MNPTVTDVHQDQILQNVSIRYKNGLYIADSIAPVVPVTKRSDKYYIFSKADDFRDTAEYRAPGTSSNRDGFTLSTDTYYCKEIAQSTQLEDEVKANADSVLRIETAKTNFVTNKILLKWEILTASLFTTTSNWDNSATPSVKWDIYETSDPIDDIETAIDTVESGHGHVANTMIISKNVWKKLKHHPALLARLSNDTTRILSIDDLKKIFDIPNIYIGNTTKNTAQQGQTASYSNIWDKDVWIGYITDTPGLEQPTAVYTFVWNYAGTGIRGVRRWRDENIHSDIIESYQSFDQKIVGSDLGYVIENAIT